MTLTPTQDVADVCEISQVSSLERADLSVEISCLLVHVINQLFVLFFSISLIQFISQLHLLKAEFNTAFKVEICEHLSFLLNLC